MDVVPGSTQPLAWWLALEERWLCVRWMLNWSAHSSSNQRQHECEPDVLVLLFASSWPCVFGQVPSLSWASSLTKESPFFLSSSSLSCQMSLSASCYYLWSIIESIVGDGIFLFVPTVNKVLQQWFATFSVWRTLLCVVVLILEYCSWCVVVGENPSGHCFAFFPNNSLLLFNFSHPHFPHITLSYPTHPQLPLSFQTILEMSRWNLEFFRESSIRDCLKSLRYTPCDNGITKRDVKDS